MSFGHCQDTLGSRSRGCPGKPEGVPLTQHLSPSHEMRAGCLWAEPQSLLNWIMGYLIPPCPPGAWALPGGL